MPLIFCILGSCAFGIECNSFKNDNSEFRKNCIRAAKIINPFSFSATIGFFYPNIARKLHIKITDQPSSDFFLGITNDIIKHREEHQETCRNDFIKLLIEIKHGSSELGTLTNEEIAAEAYLFFLGAFETSSSAMTYCLFELSKQQDIQENLRQEINAELKKHDGELIYESLNEMKLLQSVIDGNNFSLYFILKNEHFFSFRNFADVSPIAIYT